MNLMLMQTRITMGLSMTNRMTRLLRNELKQLFNEKRVKGFLPYYGERQGECKDDFNTDHTGEHILSQPLHNTVKTLSPFFIESCLSSISENLVIRTVIDSPIVIRGRHPHQGRCKVRFKRSFLSHGTIVSIVSHCRKSVPK